MVRMKASIRLLTLGDAATVRAYLSRTDRIIDWGRNARNSAVRSAAGQIATWLEAPEGDSGDHDRSLTRQTAAARVLFYRRVLAAWQFLLAVDARGPLAELHQLIAIERTPLPQ